MVSPIHMTIPSNIVHVCSSPLISRPADQVLEAFQIQRARLEFSTTVKPRVPVMTREIQLV